MPPPRQHSTNAERQAAYRQRQAQARAAEQQSKGLPALPTVPTLPGSKRWQAMQEQARALLQTMADEMQVYYDDRSEAWQESDKAEVMQTRLDTVNEILEQLESLSP